MEKDNKKDAKTRINCYVAKDIRDYVDSECQYYGISIGAYLSMMIKKQQEQQQAIQAMNSMGKLDALLNTVEELKEKLNK